MPFKVYYLNSNRLLSFYFIILLVYAVCKVSKYGVFSGPYFPVFGLNTEIYGVNLRMQSEYRKIRIRKNSVFGHFSRSVSHIEFTLSCHLGFSSDYHYFYFSISTVFILNVLSVKKLAQITPELYTFSCSINYFVMVFFNGIPGSSSCISTWWL